MFGGKEVKPKSKPAFDKKGTPTNRARWKKLSHSSLNKYEREALRTLKRQKMLGIKMKEEEK